GSIAPPSAVTYTVPTFATAVVSTGPDSAAETEHVGADGSRLAMVVCGIAPRRCPQRNRTPGGATPAEVGPAAASVPIGRISPVFDAFYAPTARPSTTRAPRTPPHRIVTAELDRALPAPDP